MRQLSSKETAGAQRCCRAVCRVARPRAKRTLRVAAIFDPPPFQPEKLTVSWQKGTTRHHSSAGLPRKYTLTHNDITGALQLTVGSDFNYAQISGFYTRLLRDEVVAEWAFDPRPVLHIYCHVSGEDRWLAPPFLRNYIFRREIPLVLEAFMWADKELLLQHPELANADVLVHFQSSSQELDSVEVWGVLSQRSTWQPVPTSILKRMLSAIMGDQLWGMGRGASSQPLLTQSSQQACTDLEVDASAQSGMLSERDLVPVPIAVDDQGSAGRQAGAGSWTLRPSDLVLVPPDLEQHHSLTHSLPAPGTSQPASAQSARQMQVGQRQGQQQGMVAQESDGMPWHAVPLPVSSSQGSLQDSSCSSQACTSSLCQPGHPASGQGTAAAPSAHSMAACACSSRGGLHSSVGEESGVSGSIMPSQVALRVPRGMTGDDGGNGSGSKSSSSAYTLRQGWGSRSSTWEHQAVASAGRLSDVEVGAEVDAVVVAMPATPPCGLKPLPHAAYARMMKSR